MKSISHALVFLAMAASLKSQTHVSMQIDVSNIVDYVLTNPAGQRSGIDPRLSDNSGHDILFKEIPNASYSYMSLGDLYSNNNSDVTAEFNGDFTSPQDDGIFRIDLIGRRSGKFDFYLSLSSSDTTRAQKTHFSIFQVPIKKDSVISYLFTYHGAPGSPISLVKNVPLTN